jgi:hypothetical protein
LRPNTSTSPAYYTSSALSKLDKFFTHLTHLSIHKRICFELLDMLEAHKKGIRRAANNTFGYVTKAIGPQDVLATLLGNFRVQERQYRVCTAVAIGIVAETCAPFTVLPALMNEYRVPELNVQNEGPTLHIQICLWATLAITAHLLCAIRRTQSRRLRATLTRAPTQNSDIFLLPPSPGR